jgi:hypothetical protein
VSCHELCSAIELTRKRLLIGTFFEAAVALLNNVIQHPFHPHTFSDIALLEPFTELLQHLDDGGDNAMLHNMHKRCSALILEALTATNVAQDILGKELVVERNDDIV